MMPIVVFANVYVFEEQEECKAAEVRVQSRNQRDIFRELALRFPHIEHKLLIAGGEPGPALALFRDSNGENLQYTPEYVVAEDERLVLISTVAC
jgi:hypothetical protein